MAARKYPSKIFPCSFLSNRLEFQGKILRTYLIVPMCTQQSYHHIISFQRYSDAT